MATYSGRPKVWSIKQSEPSFEDFDDYVAFKLNKVIISNEEKLKKRLLKNSNETFTVIVYKWVQTVDRAGAADEEQQQCLVNQLKERWGNSYDAHEAVWRIWASLIHSRRARYQIASEVNKPPPPELFRLFTPTSTRLQAHNNQVIQNINFGKDIVQSRLEEHARLKEFLKTAMNTLDMRLDAMKDVLDTKMWLLEAFGRDLPCRDGEMADFLHVIPNIPDNDHVYQDGDDDEML
ncbi:hypothetical protein AC1031_019882 [Aphanomyces cochlioides]|nr:hypothetical protein AC1031_019882 [Aphanomyces cochlioides]